MEYKEIKKLMDDVGDSKLAEVEIEFPDGTKVSLKKDQEEKLNQQEIQEEQYEQEEKKGSLEDTKKMAEEIKKQGNIVRSPMVGTFYAKSSPTAENFVRVGSKVKRGDTLCIIEAMKLMNEIESEYDGEVVEILVENEETVDYGKPLFVIK